LPSRHRTNPHASGVDDAAQSLAFKTPHSQWSTPFKHRWVTSHERRSFKALFEAIEREQAARGNL